MSSDMRAALAAAVALSPADSEKHRVAVALRLATHAAELRDAVDVLVRFALGEATGIEVSDMGKRLVREKAE